jgi:hypothetical protein
MSVTSPARPDITRPEVVTTLVSVVGTDGPDDQDRMAAEVIRRWRGGPWPVELAAVSCFGNLNGRSILVYEQWTSASAARNSRLAADVPRSPEILTEPPVEFALYRTVLATPVSDPPPVVECYPVVFPPVESGVSARATVDRMLAAEEAETGPERAYPGCVAGHMHVSADDAAIMVLSEWESAEFHTAHFESVWKKVLTEGERDSSGDGRPDIDHHFRHYATVTATDGAG